MIYEHGKFLFEENSYQKTINLNRSYANSPVVKLSSDDNTTLYLSEVTNTYFIVNKNTSDEANVHYIVIERS